ncbi:heavy metal-binding domain-containing protein [Sneathiella sp.]|uniref:heavy metal-binding domain-containing protein n=1 Tax=Sneathiella sp. TaxID=1964365 RepID=UPI0035690A13
MIITTTGSIDGKTITGYLGVVGGQAVMGTNFIRDFFARVTDKLGGRSDAYQKEIRNARALALEDMREEAEDLSAHAIIGVGIDVEVIGDSMLMVTVSGTAVTHS